MKNQKGFSLIELLLVVGVILIISGDRRAQLSSLAHARQ
jgi:prepilin-type N-terminal cleavage/methylation domain-containing protein